MTRHSLLLAAVLLAAPTSAAPPVTAAAYRTDGKLLAAAAGNTVHLIDPAKGEAVAELSGPGGRITGLAFSPPGLLAVAGGEAGRAGVVRVYAVSDPKKLPGKPTAEFAAHKDAIYAVAFSPDGKTLATAGYDRQIKLWDVPLSSDPSPRLTLTDHSDAVYGLAFRPDGKLLASASADRAVKVWDPATGRRLYTLSDPVDWVYAVAWSPDGKRLAAGGADKSIRVWDADEKGGALVTSVFAHDRAVTQLFFRADGSALVSVGEDRVAKVWDPAKMVETKVLPAQPADVFAAALRPDGNQLVVGRFDGTLVLLDPATGKTAATPLPVKPKPPTVARVSPDAVVRGKSARITFDGANLAGVTKVAADVSGVQAAVVAHTPNRLVVEVAAPESVAAGPVQLRLVSPGGESVPQRVWVDRFPTVREDGQTDSARSAMSVALPATVAGTLDRAGDVDFFRFTAAAGQELGAQLHTAADRAKFDPVLVLTAEAGQVLAEGSGGLLGYVCPRAGTYTVAVRDRDYRGGADYAYRLDLGPVPVVTSVFPLGVTRGRETVVRVSGVNLGRPGGLEVKVAPPADAAVGSTLRLPITRTGGDPVGKAEVVVGEFPADAVSNGSATLPAVPGTADGVLVWPGETHAVRFRARKGERLIVETHAARLGSPADTALEVLDASGKPVPRAALRCTAKTFVTFRDHDSEKPGIRLDAWNELRMDDLLYVDGELVKILALPKGPDDDAQFYQVDARRVGFLDTTPTFHALGTPMYKVEVHPPGSTFPPNGMPVFQLYYRNDDGGPGYGKDARIFFDPPADGEYVARVREADGAAGPAHAYRLTVRPPRPDFTVRVGPAAPTVWKGGAVPLTVTASRLDGYDGPIAVRFDGVKPPFRVPETVIEAGQLTAVVALQGGTEPSKEPARFKVVASAVIDGKEVRHEAAVGPVKVAEPGDLTTATDVSELVIRPGAEARMRVKIERRNGFAGRVPLDVRGLPHGVRVMNIGLNGILITPDLSEREVVVYAEPWVQPTERPIVVLSRSERKGTEHAAPSVLLRVQR